MRDKEIGYGVSLFNKTKVTSINVDNWEHYITFVCERGMNMQVLKITMECAIDMGIINLEPLLKMIPKTSDK